MIYVYPKLSKYNFIFFRRCSTGLGNLLLIWSKSIIFAKENNLKIISPTWLQLSIGPFIRFEKDKRTYFNLFRAHKEEIKFIKKYYLLLTAKKISIDDFKKDKDYYVKSDTNYIISFTELSDFSLKKKYNKFILNYLRKIVKHEHQQGLNFDFKGSITIHVRKGDFIQTNQSTPDAFFVDMVTKIRQFTDKNLKVYLFTDAKNSELVFLFKSIDNIERISFGSSIADILALSNSNILIASKNSSFSWWGGFLDQNLLIWPLGSKITTNSIGDTEVVVNCFEELPDSFLKYLKKL